MIHPRGEYPVNKTREAKIVYDRVLLRTDTPDVVVVGGGIIGTSIAWRLARHCRVSLFDAGVLGGEASWAGAGMLVPASEYDSACPELTFALDSLKQWPSYVAELESESGARIDFRLCGSVELAATEAEFEKLRARAAVHRGLGIDCSPVAGGEVRRMLPGLTGNVYAGVLYPKEGQVNPRSVMSVLRRECVRWGVSIRERARITKLSATEKGVAIEVEDGQRIEAWGAVIAAGAWSNQIDANVALPRCYPVRGHLVGYSLKPGSLPHVLRFHKTYLVQRLTGYTIAGASEENAGFDRAVDDGIVADLSARAHELAGGIVPAAPEDAWVGFRPASDSGPFLDRVDGTRAWLAYGHYRNGILLAPKTADAVSSAIVASLGTS